MVMNEDITLLVRIAIVCTCIFFFFGATLLSYLEISKNTTNTGITELNSRIKTKYNSTINTQKSFTNSFDSNYNTLKNNLTNNKNSLNQSLTDLETLQNSMNNVLFSINLNKTTYDNYTSAKTIYTNTQNEINKTIENLNTDSLYTALFREIQFWQTSQNKYNSIKDSIYLSLNILRMVLLLKTLYIQYFNIFKTLPSNGFFIDYNSETYEFSYDLLKISLSFNYQDLSLNYSISFHGTKLFTSSLKISSILIGVFTLSSLGSNSLFLSSIPNQKSLFSSTISSHNFSMQQISTSDYNCLSSFISNTTDLVNFKTQFPYVINGSTVSTINNNFLNGLFLIFHKSGFILIEFYLFIPTKISYISLLTQKDYSSQQFQTMKYEKFLLNDFNFNSSDFINTTTVSTMTKTYTVQNLTETIIFNKLKFLNYFGSEVFFQDIANYTTNNKMNNIFYIYSTHIAGLIPFYNTTILIKQTFLGSTMYVSILIGTVTRVFSVNSGIVISKEKNITADQTVSPATDFNS